MSYIYLDLYNTIVVHDPGVVVTKDISPVHVRTSLVDTAQKMLEKWYTSTVHRENFALWPEGEFKTGLIEFCTKDYVSKLESGRIQDSQGKSVSDLWRANTRMGKFKAVYSILEHIP